MIYILAMRSVRSNEIQPRSNSAAKERSKRMQHTKYAIFKFIQIDIDWNGQ